MLERLSCGRGTFLNFFSIFVDFYNQTLYNFLLGVKHLQLH